MFPTAKSCFTSSFNFQSLVHFIFTKGSPSLVKFLSSLSLLVIGRKVFSPLCRKKSHFLPLSHILSHTLGFHSPMQRVIGEDWRAWYSHLLPERIIRHLVGIPLPAGILNAKGLPNYNPTPAS